MTKNKKAGARALSCACALALAASMAPAAAAATPKNPEATNAVKVVVKEEGASTNLLQQWVTIGSSTDKKADVKAKAATQSILYYDSGWNVTTTTEYVPLEDILENAGASQYWNDSVKKITVTGEGSYSAAWDKFAANGNFYGATTKTGTDTSKSVSQVTPGIAIKTASIDLATAAENTAAEAAGQPVKPTTALAAQKYNVGALASVTNPSYTFMHGVSESNYTTTAIADQPVDGWTSADAFPTAATDEGLMVTIIVPAAPTTGAQRIYGQTWADTMQQTMTYNQTYATGNSVSNFVIATAGGYQDALAASGFAGALGATGGSGAPVLMTDSNSLTPQTASLLNYYAQRSGTVNVYVIGGKNAISDEVVASIKALDAFKANTVNVVRIKGDEAWDTSLEVRNYMVNHSDDFQVATGYDTNAIVATSGGFQDALSISSYAYNTGTPIVLTNGEAKLTDAASKLLSRMTNIWVIGGRMAVSADVTDSQLTGATVKRVYGDTAYDTSNTIATELYSATGAFSANSGDFVGATAVGVTTGENYLDALASSSFCGNVKSLDATSGSKAMPLLLVSNSDTTTVDGFLTTYASNDTTTGGKITTAKVFGGSAAVNGSVMADIEATLL